MHYMNPALLSKYILEEVVQLLGVSPLATDCCACY
jgi:hypothetical protein